ncbi:hypothetical protein PM082_004048 [Marasmius tenuissimus]|nr:hypothetical protein PM082_004048 [Marasmius tenuissimus]
MALPPEIDWKEALKQVRGPDNRDRKLFSNLATSAIRTLERIGDGENNVWVSLFDQMSTRLHTHEMAQKKNTRTSQAREAAILACQAAYLFLYAFGTRKFERTDPKHPSFDEGTWFRRAFSAELTEFQRVFEKVEDMVENPLRWQSKHIFKGSPKRYMEKMLLDLLRPLEPPDGPNAGIAELANALYQAVHKRPTPISVPNDYIYNTFNMKEIIARIQEHAKSDPAEESEVNQDAGGSQQV